MNQKAKFDIGDVVWATNKALTVYKGTVFSITSYKCTSDRYFYSYIILLSNGRQNDITDPDLHKKVMESINDGYCIDKSYKTIDASEEFIFNDFEELQKYFLNKLAERKKYYEDLEKKR